MCCACLCVCEKFVLCVCILIYFFSTSYDSSDNSEAEERHAKHKKSKKHKKHKKTSTSEKVHKKHKKSKKRHHRQSESSNASDKQQLLRNNIVSQGLSSKFTELMQASRERGTKLTPNGADFRIIKPNTDPCSLVEEITKTIQNKVLPVLEVATSGSESEVYVLKIYKCNT